MFFKRCSDGADRLREHWDQNECGLTNVTSLDQCSAISESDHTEWRNSMVTDNDITYSSQDPSGVSTAGIISAIFSTILGLILLALIGGYLYLYGRRNPGGWAEKFAARLEAPYKRFVEDSPGNNENNNNSVEMGAKVSQNNNTETGVVY